MIGTSSNSKLNLFQVKPQGPVLHSCVSFNPRLNLTHFFVSVFSSFQTSEITTTVDLDKISEETFLSL